MLYFAIFYLSFSVCGACICTAYHNYDWPSNIKETLDGEGFCKWAYISLVASIVMIIDIQVSPLVTPGIYWWPLWIFVVFGLLFSTISFIYYDRSLYKAGLAIRRKSRRKPAKTIDVVKSQNGLSKS